MTGATTPIGVFLLDDHEIVRRGLCDLIDGEPDLSVVGEAGSVAEALHRIPLSSPRVAVLDVQLGDGTGIEVCRDIRSSHPEIACLMLTSYADDEALMDSVVAGASGYVLKQVRGNDLLDGIRRVAAGQSLLDPAVTARVIERLRRGPEEDARLATLTPREGEILGLLADGLTNRQIGEALQPGREDGQEQRVQRAHEARDGAAHAGGGLRRPPRRPAGVRRPLSGPAAPARSAGCLRTAPRSSVELPPSSSARDARLARPRPPGRAGPGPGPVSSTVTSSQPSAHETATVDRRSRRVVGDVGQALAHDRGQVAGLFGVEHGVDRPVEAEHRAGADGLRQLVAQPQERAARPVARPGRHRRLQLEDRRADLADGGVELVDRRLHPLAGLRRAR